jgi:hypothetical protein
MSFSDEVAFQCQFKLDVAGSTLVARSVLIFSRSSALADRSSLRATYRKP